MEEYEGKYIFGDNRVGDEVELAPGIVGKLHEERVRLPGYVAIDVVIENKTITIDSRDKDTGSKHYFNASGYLCHIVGQPFRPDRDLVDNVLTLRYIAYREEVNPVDVSIVLPPRRRAIRTQSKSDSCRFCNSKESPYANSKESPWENHCGPEDIDYWIGGRCTDPIGSRIHSKESPWKNHCGPTDMGRMINPYGPQVHTKEFEDDVLRVGDKFTIAIGSNHKIASSPGLLIVNEGYSPDDATVMVQFEALTRGDKYVTIYTRQNRVVDTKHYKVVDR